ncbi:SseB family protein [Knoellia sp. CPCC 206450]|uniref:SseB family protein n=1 Tax=Knoellia tibetensis TaxID=3404798 RepID=UPI003B4349B2
MTRDLVFTGFEGDDGSAPPALTAALENEDPAALMAALRESRLLVPIVAEPVETATEGGLTVDKQTGMAAVTLVAPDGERALPVFSSLDALAAWDPAARPVPVTAARAGQAAVSERCDVVVVDVAGPQTRVLRPSMVWALAQERSWLPPHLDEFVAIGVARAVAEEPDVVSHHVEEGAPAGQGVLGVVLELREGLAGDEVQAVATRVGERLATDGELRARIDGLAFRIR